MFWQIPERLLHLNDWPGLVVDPALVLRRVLPLLAHILRSLVPHRPGSRWPGPQGPWPQSLCRKCQRLHIRISVQPRDSAHNWVSYDKTINSLMLYVMILISPISTLCFWTLWAEVNIHMTYDRQVKLGVSISVVSWPTALSYFTENFNHTWYLFCTEHQHD